MSDSNPSEFDIIQSFFSDLGHADGATQLGIGDDAAIVRIPVSARLCLSVDTVVEGVHFPAGTAPQHVAKRALGSALSDLAAMGAKASHFTLALTMPKSDSRWLKSFAKALHDMAVAFGVSLVGGDTTRGPLTVTVQVHGWLPPDKALTRASAREGELLVVSGTLGDAGAGLRCLQQALRDPNAEVDYLAGRFYCPSPRLLLGRQLLDCGSACIDVSDGLLSDAQHLAKASGVGLEIDASLIPLSPALQRLFPKQALELALTAGDDYELLFTLSESKFKALQSLSPVPVSVIGKVSGAGQQVSVKGYDLDIQQKGYLHFD